jgi:hypothetical protein
MAQKPKGRLEKSTCGKQTTWGPRLYVVVVKTLLNGFWSEGSFSKRLLSFVA